MRSDPRFPPAQERVFPGRCARCRMPHGACFCASIPAIPTRLHVVIIRHAREITRTSNTGRMAALALENCTLLDFGAYAAPGQPGPPLELLPLVTPGSRVLAPGVSGPVEGVDTLFVLDGTWAQVRSMRARLAALRSMKGLALPAPKAAPMRIRRGTADDQLATIEAIAAALDVVGEPEAGAALNALFGVMATKMTDLRGFEMPAKRP